MGPSARRGLLRPICAALTVLVAFALLVVVGGAHHATTRTSVGSVAGTSTAGTSVRAVDHVLTSHPQHAPNLDPVALTDAPVVAAPSGVDLPHTDSPSSLDRVAPVASGRGPPTL